MDSYDAMMSSTVATDCRHSQADDTINSWPSKFLALCVKRNASLQVVVIGPARFGEQCISQRQFVLVELNLANARFGPLFVVLLLQPLDDEADEIGRAHV